MQRNSFYATIAAEVNQARQMEHIAHHAQDTQILDLVPGLSEPSARPDDQIVGQGVHWTMICWASKRFLLRLVMPSPCLSSLISVSTPPTAQIVEVDVSQQDSQGVLPSLGRYASQETDLFQRQSGDQHADSPLAVLLAGTNGNALHRSDILRRLGGDPSHLSTWYLRVVKPRHDRLGQFASPIARVFLGMDVVASGQARFGEGRLEKG